MVTPDLFADPGHLGLETIAKEFAGVYKLVSLAHLPMYRWLQIVNDVTILAEETRHGPRRRQQAKNRAIKVLLRLLDFLGFYLYVARKPQVTNELTRFVANCLKSSSYPGYGYFDKREPQEGPSRWIYAKYPLACAKCGKKPCRCVVHPWIFEERRQNPEKFFTFRDEVFEKRSGLRKAWREGKITYLTLPTLFKFFADIYRGSYYHLDPWKVVMHLSEEVGEATTELTRLELLFLMKDKGYKLNKKRLGAIESQTKAIMEEKLTSIEKEETKDKVRKETITTMEKALGELRHNKSSMQYLSTMVADKFKEEIADIFSWLSAVIYQLSDGAVLDNKALVKLLIDNKYIKFPKHQLRFTCPQCEDTECENDCLVENAIAAEMYEKVARL